MNTIGATTVFSGRDNSGQAAIVDSTYDNSFMQNMLGQIAQDNIRKQQKRERDEQQRKQMMKDARYVFDPIGVQELDAEMMGAVDAYENWLAEQYAIGNNPSDPTTEAGKEAARMKRELQLRNIQGKNATAQLNLALKAGELEGVDLEHNTNWIKGYRDVKPKEGETLAQAVSRYVEENPYQVKKAYGLYDFITPLIPNIEYATDPRGNKSINPKNVEFLIDQYMLTPEGQQKFNDMAKGKRYEDFKADQVKLIMEKFPYQAGKIPTRSSGSSSGGGSDSEGLKYKLTHSDDSGMFSSGNPSVNNGIVLTNAKGDNVPAIQIKNQTGSVEDGVPLAINKGKDGKIYLEYAVSLSDEETGEDRISGEKRYVPYELVRDQVIQMYGKDIALELDATTTTPKSSSLVPSGGNAR